MTRYQYYRSQREPDISVNSAVRRAAEGERSAPPCNPDRPSPFAWGVPGMAYVPDLGFVNLYTPTEALPAGTLFRDLDYPFLGGGKR